MERSEACHICGNHHSGNCSFQVTYFEWKPEIYESTPHNVDIVGQWYKWQNRESMTKQTDKDGNPYFTIGISIPVGRYQYRYIVDGKWTYNKYAPTVLNPYGEYNNVVEVLPKKAFLQYVPKQDTKITSSITLKGLKIIGSWDNWKNEVAMQLTYNNLKGCEENFVYLELVPNTAYEFKFKVRNQYLVDEKYPTVHNQFGTLNNRLVICNEVLSTPTGWRTSKISSHIINCKAFQWSRVQINPGLVIYKKTVEGHSMCLIGDYLYIFGGKVWGDFTNNLSKVHIHRLHTVETQQIFPAERAYHCAQSYGNKMIIYGGHNQKILEDYNIFNSTQSIWTSSPEILGKFPNKRQKQSCVLYEMLLVFFGGYYCSPDFEFQKNFNDIQVLDIQEMRWIDTSSMQIPDPKPAPRHSHTATLIYSEMFVFGGIRSNFNEPEHKNYNDLWMINLQKVNQLKWEQIQGKGKPPRARHGHSCNSLQNYLIIFGGQDNKQLFNDIIVFNRENREWIHPLIKSKNLQDQPVPRAFHAATTVNSEYIIIFGGKSKNSSSTSFYILKPVEVNTELEIEEESDEDLQTESNVYEVQKQDEDGKKMELSNRKQLEEEVDEQIKEIIQGEQKLSDGKIVEMIE